ncbi:hypothetical protein F0562_031346 [Nyssa sinensis]|uniref:Band 7 domain-containing protein n=1 Tax=Nyssa sinensis TaxID=561372 RepID=A0A5J5ATW6_9ASTE|nr:hypothetical protein F0562_031346 [Nyssa sinensis]
MQITVGCHSFTETFDSSLSKYTTLSKNLPPNNAQPNNIQKRKTTNPTLFKRFAAPPFYGPVVISNGKRSPRLSSWYGMLLIYENYYYKFVYILQDNVFVQMLCSIQYRVIKENADDAFYELQNPKEQIQAYVFDVVRALVPRMTLDELFEQKGEIAKSVLEELEKVMGAYGYNIEHILMVDIIPDESVRKAMNEINTAQRLQLASVYKGEAEKVLQVKKAEGEAEAKYLGGIGVARQRQAITDGLRENILNFSHKVEGTSAKEVMDLIMITQYFDTIKDLGNSSKNTTVFIPHGPGHVRDISDQIRNGLMEADSAKLNV